MDFGPLDSADVLEQFDFDSFLNTDDASGGAQFFDPSSMSFDTNGLEAGNEGV
jgi:hypothetical protein